MSDFPWVALGEIASVRSGYAFKSSDWQASGIPVVKIANVKGGRLEMEGCSFVDDVIAEQAAEFRLAAQDILIAMTGYIGEVARVTPQDLPALLNQRVGKFSVRDPQRLDADFLYQLLTWQVVRSAIEGLGYGSAQPNVSPTLIGTVKVPLPDLQRQRDIACTLGALDDKIELNRRMNETLEAMARAIFQDWFVAFGPTRAKMEGRPPYLAPDLWALFPDRLDAEGKPEGWEASTIGEEVTVVGGTTPSTKEPAYWNGDLHWATPKDLSNLAVPVLLDTERRITAKGLSQIGSGLLPAGSVLLSSRAPIGYLAVNLVPTAINQGFIGMVCEKRLSNMFVWLWTKANMEAILQKANGSTFQEISKSNFRPIPVVVPGTGALGAFEAAVRPLWDRLCANVREQGSLAATRDLLLPRLMSGELRVKDAERAVEETA